MKVTSFFAAVFLLFSSLSLQGEDQCDLVVFSYNRPMQLFAFLESTKEHVEGLRKIFVIYREEQTYHQGYEIVKQAFPEVIYYKQSNTQPKKDFKPLVMRAAFGKENKQANYLIFAVDDIIVKDKINLLRDIESLKSTHAYGFYYRLGKHVTYCYSCSLYQGIPPFVTIGEDCFKWQFKEGEGDWDYGNSVDFVLYEKSSIYRDINTMHFTFPNDLEGGWANRQDKEKFGLCHETSKIVNIPMNLVSTICGNRAMHIYSTEELNSLFLDNLKIDIRPYFQVKNISAHADITPSFIPRL